MTTAAEYVEARSVYAPDWLSPKQVHLRTGRNVTTVYLALESGELHGHQSTARKGGRWRVWRESVDAWMRRQDTREPCCPATVTPLRRSRRKTS